MLKVCKDILHVIEPYITFCRYYALNPLPSDRDPLPTPSRIILDPLHNSSPSYQAHDHAEQNTHHHTDAETPYGAYMNIRSGLLRLTFHPELDHIQA